MNPFQLKDVMLGVDVELVGSSRMMSGAWRRKVNPGDPEDPSGVPQAPGLNEIDKDIHITRDRHRREPLSTDTIFILSCGRRRRGLSKLQGQLFIEVAYLF